MKKSVLKHMHAQEKKFQQRLNQQANKKRKKEEAQLKKGSSHQPSTEGDHKQL